MKVYVDIHEYGADPMPGVDMSSAPGGSIFLGDCVDAKNCLRSLLSEMYASRHLLRRGKKLLTNLNEKCVKILGASLVAKTQVKIVLLLKHLETIQNQVMFVFLLEATGSGCQAGISWPIVDDSKHAAQRAGAGRPSQG